MVIAVSAGQRTGRADAMAMASGSFFMGTSGKVDRSVNGPRRQKGYHFAMKFRGTDTYVADDDLKLAVNAAITLQRPLLIKGEPETVKTMLAGEVSHALGKPRFHGHSKSTTQPQQGLYDSTARSLMSATLPAT